MDRSRRRLARAVWVAGVSGWIMAFFGAVSLLTGWGSVTALLIGALLVLCAWNELGGRKRLRAMEAGAPVQLSRNQVFTALGVGGYCLLCALKPAEMDPDLRAALAQAGVGADVDRIFELAARITRAVYFFVIAATLVVQVFTGLFYLSRERDIAVLRAS